MDWNAIFRTIVGAQILRAFDDGTFESGRQITDNGAFASGQKIRRIICAQRIRYVVLFVPEMALG